MKETTAEFLSGFHKEDKLKPVITVTVYFGTDKWDAPRNLQEMFDVQDSYIQRFLPDYPIPLILTKEIQDYTHFQSESERKVIASQMKKEGFSDEMIAHILQISIDNVRELFLK